MSVCQIMLFMSGLYVAKMVCIKTFIRLLLLRMQEYVMLRRIIISILTLWVQVDQIRATVSVSSSLNLEGD